MTDGSLLLNAKTRGDLGIDGGAIQAHYGRDFTAVVPSPAHSPGAVPVYMTYERPWGTLSFGVTPDAARRLVSFVVSMWPAAAPAGGLTSVTNGAINSLVELHLTRPESASYFYSVCFAGSELFDGGPYSSLSAALAAAAEDGADFLGLQLGYQGVVIGTYTPGEVLAGSEAIAERCVERSAVFNQQQA